MELNIRTSTLKASIFCAADKDIRYYLNGVLIDFRGTHVNVVSTDGHILSAFRAENPEGLSDVQIIIPIETIKSAVKTKQKFLRLISLDNGRYMLGDIAFTAIGGKFPDYERVIPQTINGETALLQPELVLRCVSAMRTFHGTKKDAVFNVHQNGNGVSVICSDDNTGVAVCMPVRVSNTIGQKYYGFSI